MPKVSPVAKDRYVHVAADLHAFENPDSGVAVPSTVREEAIRLAEIAAEAQEAYIEAMEAYVEKEGRVNADLLDMYDDMERIAAEFFRQYNPEMVQDVTASYGLGILGAQVALWDQGYSMVSGDGYSVSLPDNPLLYEVEDGATNTGFDVSFTAPDRSAMAAIANDNFTDLAGQTKNMIDGAVGILRTEAGRVLTQAVAEGLNPVAAARRLETELKAKGFKTTKELEKLQAAVDKKTNPYNGTKIQKDVTTPINAARFVDEGGNYAFVDRAGRQWDLRKYCEMAAHTKIMIAKNEGTRNRMADADVYHYMFSNHNTDCPICGPHEGVVYWTGTGDSLGYAFGPDIPLHPNCEHSTVPYVII